MSFDDFWSRYPRKIKRLDAEKAFMRALRVTSGDTIMAGLERYLANKPDYADWAHASSWLNGQRWTDEYETAVSVGGILRDCPHHPPCEKRWACGRRQQMERAS